MNMKALFIALLVSLVLPLAANAQNENFQDRSARTVSPGPDAAQVSGIMGKPNRELFGVRFVAINGRNIPPRQSMWLEPGSYTLTVAIDASHTRRPPQRRNFNQREAAGQNEIELELEAGKTYEIRARYNHENRDAPYSLVVHRIKEN